MTLHSTTLGVKGRKEAVRGAKNTPPRPLLFQKEVQLLFKSAAGNLDYFEVQYRKDLGPDLKHLKDPSKKHVIPLP